MNSQEEETLREVQRVQIFTCFVLEDEVEFIHLLERLGRNDYLLVQQLVEFGTDRAT